MSDYESNPYAPPATVEEPISGRARPSVDLLVCIGIFAFCYIGFTIALLMSGGNADFGAGCWFVFNVPVMLFWLLANVRGHRFALIAGLGTAAVQAVIMLDMYDSKVNDTKAVITINGGIITVLLALVWLSRRSTQKRIQAND